MAMLDCVDKELSTSDKELLVLVYLGLRNNMIEQYMDDIIHALCSIEISYDKKDYNRSCLLGYVGLSIFTQFG